MQNDINNFIMLVDIFGGVWHDLVYDLTEQVGVSTRVLSYRRYGLSTDSLMLIYVINVRPSEINKITNLRNILQIDDEHLLLAVRYPLLFRSQNNSRRVSRKWHVPAAAYISVFSPWLAHCHRH